MIIKSLTRKDPSFSQAIRYILNKEQDKRLCWIVLHNMDRVDADVATLIEAFKKNDSYRKKNKRSTVALYHEVVSFSDLDKEAIIANSSIMEDMARLYLQIRSNGIGFAFPHYDTNHAHFHVLLSANEKESSKSIRISQSRFAAIKREMEQYLQKTYPEIRHSLIEKHLRSRKKEKIARDY